MHSHIFLTFSLSNQTKCYYFKFSCLGTCLLSLNLRMWAHWQSLWWGKVELENLRLSIQLWGREQLLLVLSRYSCTYTVSMVPIPKSVSTSIISICKILKESTILHLSNVKKSNIMYHMNCIMLFWQLCMLIHYFSYSCFYYSLKTF